MSTDKHLLVALMENRPGVLNRVVSLFRQRNFNLDSLTVGRTEREHVSRMTLVLDGSRADTERLRRELCKLIQVIRVEHLTEVPHVKRDLALIKVTVTPETRPEIQHICDVFRARIIDMARDTLAVELTGDEDKIEGFIELVRPFGIVELVRTGLVAIGRGEHILDDHNYRSTWAERQGESGAATSKKGETTS
jgi:acetolactate synthase-1/3 small subunit